MTGTEEHALQPTTAVEIRTLTELSEFDLCVEIETAVWGYDPADMIPRRMFLLASRIGGQVMGAFAGGTMAGFAMALPGYRHGHPYLHSHMVGVLPEFRNLGLGRKLKLAQREDALARGFELMEWTFDPLEIKNAHLNIARLGAIVRRYKRNFYGPSSSPLQGGLPTDRVYAEWWLRSKRVCGVLARRTAEVRGAGASECAEPDIQMEGLRHAPRRGAPHPGEQRLGARGCICARTFSAGLSTEQRR